ncbi:MULTISPECIES: SDR family NAD(P)-dependent oxidoreductase [Streptomyces]|uniref:Oxidoreductase n=1 Tax=Streptomyces galilaeus TaxID=33899 RepID=A0ABW9IXV4_STRGJ
MSSGAHRGTPFDFEDPQYERRPYDPWTAYGQPKSAGVLFAVGACRWAGDGITADALNPGFILTRLQRHLAEDTMRAGLIDSDGNLTPPPFYKSPAQGAATSVLLAASPLLDGVTGCYFEDHQMAQAVQRDEEGRSAGVATHALDPEAAEVGSGSTRCCPAPHG